jgi:predicted ATPase
VPEEPLTGIDVDVAFASLVDKSLVAREFESGWYRLLETIRAFVLERLTEQGEREAAFEQHRRWTVASATAATTLDRAMSGRLAARQRVGAADSHQAFWSSLAAGHVDDAVELAVARSFRWRNAVGCVEGHRWVEALASADLEPRDSSWGRPAERRHRARRR